MDEICATPRHTVPTVQEVLDAYGVMPRTEPPTQAQITTYNVAEDRGFSSREARTIADAKIDADIIRHSQISATDAPFPVLLAAMLAETQRRQSGGRRTMGRVGRANKINRDALDAVMGLGESKDSVLQAAGFASIPEGPGIVARIDQYTLSVDGVRYRATPEQEVRIRSLTPDQREQFHKVMGNGQHDLPPADTDSAEGWEIKDSFRDGGPRTAINRGSRLTLTRVNFSRRDYTCPGNVGPTPCPDPVIPPGSPYVWVRDTFGTELAKGHPGCVRSVHAGAVDLLFPEGIPLVQPRSQSVLAMDPAIHTVRGGIKYPTPAELFDKAPENRTFVFDPTTKRGNSNQNNVSIEHTFLETDKRRDKR